MRTIISLFGYCSIFLLGCAPPAQNFLETALAYDFKEYTLLGKPFQHKIYTNKQAHQANTILHVYLDGDGTPWRRQGWIANDPTARNPLILRLMTQDKQPALLLGRPCYYGLSQSLNCEPSLWTEKRYAKNIVDSMATALNNWLKQQQVEKIVLIGYSGGGTLAVLMANKIIAVTKVITFAANLDVKAWSLHHGYPPLNQSLNPINQPPLASHIKQLHFAGAEDDNVPAFVIQNYVKQQLHAKFEAYPELDHQCCWEEQWKQILTKIEGLE